MPNIAVPAVATGTQTSADTVLGVQSGVVKRFPSSPAYSQLAAVTGSALVGFDYAQVYGSGTAGQAIKALSAIGVDSLVDGPTIVVNISSIARIKDVTLGGNRTFTFSGTNSVGTVVALGDPALAGLDGKQLLLRVKQDATGSRVPTLGTGVRFGSDLPSVTFSGLPLKTDYVGLIYNHAAATVDVVAFSRGY